MPDRDNIGSVGTAVVVLGASMRSQAGYSTTRADSRLVTQLLAMRHDAAVYRNRRRADPGTATSAYSQAASLSIPLAPSRIRSA